MKRKKKMILFISVLVALISIAAVIVVQTGAMDAIVETFAPREDAVIKRTFATAGKKIPLTYVETATFEGAESLDIYMDADGNEYRYYHSGELANIFMSVEADATKEIRLSKETAVNLALEKGKELLGAEMDAFQLDSYQEFAWGDHSVTFAIRYGNGGYIQGQTVIFTINKDGAFKGMAKRYTEKFKKFDPKWAKEFTQEDVEVAVLKKAKEKFPDATCCVETISLQYDTVFYLNVSVGITHSNGSGEMETFRYDFDQK